MNKRICQKCSNEAIGQDPESLYWAYDGLCMECYDNEYRCPECDEMLVKNTGFIGCEYCGYVKGGE